ncbi:MAG: hypothetical protein AB2L20_11955 [Mangrovibacterium sp.]
MTEDIELTEDQKKEIEIKAIEALLQTGFEFEIPLKIKPKNPSRLALVWCKILHRQWRDKRIPKDWDVSTTVTQNLRTGEDVTIYVRNIVIPPLFLGTIDAIRKLRIGIEFDEKRVQEAPIAESNRLYQYIPEMAEICAVATLNKGVSTENERNIKTKTKELKLFYLNHLTSSNLFKLANVVNQMSDPANFTASIRSIQETPSPTKPNLIE